MIQYFAMQCRFEQFISSGYASHEIVARAAGKPPYLKPLRP